MVNALRFAVNKVKVDNYQNTFFSPRDIGANIYSYLPGYMSLTITGGFTMYTGTNTNALFLNDTYQVAEDLTLVRGNHQLGVGGNVQYWKGDYTSTSRANGNWIFDGRATGLGLADLMVGRVTSVEHGGLGKLPVNSWYVGGYAQDSWRVSSRVTINGGVRWEPFFGQNVENGVISVFDMENFQQGVKSTVFLNAPAGLLYDGDAGFPDNGKTGLNKQWWNLSPRAGVAWDVHGDGRLAVRTSYAMAYDFMSGEYHNISANAPPFGNRSLITDPVGRFDNPYGGVPGGDPHPITTGPTTQYPAFGSFGTMDPGDQLAAHSVVEPHGRAADRQPVGCGGQLSRKPLRSAVGAGRPQPRCVHGTGRLHDQRCGVPRLLDQCEPQPAASALPAESARGGAHRIAG